MVVAAMRPSRVDVVIAALGLGPMQTRGDRGWIQCPLHDSDSKTRTWFVRRHGENAGRWHCFSCKKSGGLVMLAMALRGIERDEARTFVREAGKGFQPPKARARVVARQPVLGRHRFAMPPGILYEPFDDWLTMAREYWTQDRGLDSGHIDRYRVGYAVDGTLAGRVVIPFLAEDGRAGTYSARTFVDSDPKYRTPHEDEGPDLELVFGMHTWPPIEQRRNMAIAVTEGAIDGISIEQAMGRWEDGGLCVGSLGGSDVRPGHLVSLATFGLVIAATDADPPGDKAATAIRSGLGRHAKVVRCRLPVDANKMLRRRPRALRERLSSALAGRAS